MRIEPIERESGNVEDAIRLYVRAFSFLGGSENVDEKEIERRMREHIEKGVLLAAVKHDKVVGIFGSIPLRSCEDGENVIEVLSTNGIDVDGNEFIMSMLAVSEEYRGRGIGSILCHHGEMESFVKSDMGRFFSRSGKDAIEMNSLLVSRGYKIVADGIFVTNGVLSREYIWTKTGDFRPEAKKEESNGNNTEARR